MGVAICDYCGSPEYACWCEALRERLEQYYDEDEIDKMWFSKNAMLNGETFEHVAKTGKPTDILRVIEMLIGELACNRLPRR
jgi:hypothetical protein